MNKPYIKLTKRRIYWILGVAIVPFGTVLLTGYFWRLWKNESSRNIRNNEKETK